MSEIIRNPKQKRSIDKKNRIIEAGYSLFAKVGYYKTNTAEIAKEAGVSTGIVYGYFHDKRDILIEVLNIYINKVFSSIYEMLDNLTLPLNFDYFFSHVLDNIIFMHQNNASIHEALHALTHSDKEVRNRFLELEDEMTEKVVQKLERMGFRLENLPERVHLAIRTIEDYAHEAVYDNHDYIDYEVMKKISVSMLKSLFDVSEQ